MDPVICTAALPGRSSSGDPVVGHLADHRDTLDTRRLTRHGERGKPGPAVVLCTAVAIVLECGGGEGRRTAARSPATAVAGLP